jgi:hypothetical protein
MMTELPMIEYSDLTVIGQHIRVHEPQTSRSQVSVEKRGLPRSVWTGDRH